MIDPNQAFAALPAGLARDLLDALSEVLTNYAEQRWEPSELNGGKLCEAAYTVVEGFLNGGAYSARALKPRNMVDACNALERAYPKAPRSPRIQVPRMLIALYEIRNNRGVGHAGGDINPNEMDATAVLYMAKWIVAELVRLLHDLTVEEAGEVVEDLVERESVLIWHSGDTRRVLQTGLTQRKQVLLLLTGVRSATLDEVGRWMEHKRLDNLRSNVLRPMHKERLIEFDEASKSLQLLPPGRTEAEALIRSLRR